MGFHEHLNYTRAWSRRARLTNDGEGSQRLIVTSEYPGIKTITVWEPTLVIEDRTDCFCCSCGDREGSDSDCRNHGWDGRRPCDEHGMPGQYDEDRCMPISVQAQARRQEAEDRSWRAVDDARG